MKKINSQKMGILYMVAASLLFATGGLLCKMVSWNALSINGMRNLLAALVIGLYMKTSGHKLKINKTTLLGALCMMMVTTLFVLANKLTTAANAILLQYSAPVWIILLSFLLLKKKPVRLDIITCLLVFLGIVLFFLDSFSYGSLTGNAAALLSGLFYGGLFMMNSFEDGDTLSSSFLGQLVCGLLESPFVFFEHDFSVSNWIGILLLGLFQVGIAYILFHEGTKRVSALQASLIAGIEPVLNPLLVAWVYHESLSPLAFVAALLVFGSVFGYNLIQCLPNKKEKNAREYKYYGLE
jgi:drug/metabolite transporter (DMT)-like permease